MATKNSVSSKNEKLIEFLSEDFRDTALHMRDTDRKIEFTFQLYAGSFSLLSSVVISFLAVALGSQNWKQEYNFYVMVSVLFLLVFIWLFTWWAFMYTIKGTKMKSMYINRMNFLRSQIYNHLGVNNDKSPVFLYASKFLPSESLQKVGMVDMFPLGLRYAMTFLPLPIIIIAYGILQSLGTTFHWSVLLISLIIMWGIRSYTKNAWVKTVKDTQDKIERSWNSPDVT